MFLKPLRRLYHWTLGWAEHPSALWALFAIAFLESSCFPIPPDVLLVPLCFGMPLKGWRFAAICTAGSVIGGMAGYGIGLLLTDFGRNLILTFSNEHTLGVVQQQMQENTFLYIAIAGFTPIPYKVFTIAAGMFHVDFPTFVAASVVSRGARFFLEAGVVRLFGERARHFLEKRLEVTTVVVAALGIGGFLAVKYLF